MVLLLGAFGCPTQPFSFQSAFWLAILCVCAVLGTEYGMLGPTARGLGKKRPLWAHRLLENETSYSRHPFARLRALGALGDGGVTLRFPGARCPGQCGSHALRALFLPGWLWG